jgi:hypothetical protein
MEKRVPKILNCTEPKPYIFQVVEQLCCKTATERHSKVVLTHRLNQINRFRPTRTQTVRLQELDPNHLATIHQQVASPFQLS